MFLVNKLDPDEVVQLKGNEGPSESGRAELGEPDNLNVKFSPVMRDFSSTGRSRVNLSLDPHRDSNLLSEPPIQMEKHTDFFFDPAAPPDPIYSHENQMKHNLRVLEPKDRNFYHVTRADFQSPTIYQLNLLKPNGRVKVKTFLPLFKQNDLTDNMDRVDRFATFGDEDGKTIKNVDAIRAFKDKFYGEVATSSQLNQKKGLQTINIFEKTQAKAYSLPRTRGWKAKEPVPVPIFVNLQ